MLDGLSIVQKHQIDDYLKNPTKEKAKDIFGADSISDGFFICKACGKKTNITQIQLFDTPVIRGCRAEVCDECWKEAKKEGACYLVCMRCKELRKCMKPMRNPKSGFTMRTGQFYHLMDCPVCEVEKYKDKVVPAVLVEEAIYNNKKELLIKK